MATGFLHPGAMGASLAGSCSGARLWVGRDRSTATRARAAAAGMEEVASITELVDRVDVIVSVCPPAAAAGVAQSVAVAGFEGVYVDANAVSPATARSIGTRFERFVDGGIVGPPVQAGGSTRLYLSGFEAKRVAALWRDSPLETCVIAGGEGAASAVKACFAAWTKGTAALLLAVRALARAEGVEEALLEEWSKSMPELAQRSELVAAANAPKAWRFMGELQEIGEAFAAWGLPDGFGRAAAEVYGRLAPLKGSSAVELDAVVDALLHGHRPEPV